MDAHTLLGLAIELTCRLATVSSVRGRRYVKSGRARRVPYVDSFSNRTGRLGLENVEADAAVSGQLGAGFAHCSTVRAGVQRVAGPRRDATGARR